MGFARLGAFAQDQRGGPSRRLCFGFADAGGKSFDFEGGFVLIVEKSKQAVVVAVGNGVELVVMTLGAADAQAEQGRTGGGDSVEDRFDAELFRIDTAFLVDLGVAVEAGGCALSHGGLGQEVSGELLDEELIEGLIGVESSDDAIAVGPDGSRGIDAVSVRVGISGDVEPPAAPAFSVMR